MNSDQLAYFTAITGITSPFWLNLLAVGGQIVVPILGFFLLILTLRNKWLDGKIKSETLKDLRDE